MGATINALEATTKKLRFMRVLQPPAREPVPSCKKALASYLCVYTWENEPHLIHTLVEKTSKHVLRLCGLPNAFFQSMTSNAFVHGINWSGTVPWKLHFNPSAEASASHQHCMS